MDTNVFIRGQIGSDGMEKGVELIDVIAQVQPLETKELYIEIDSPGGLVDVGNAIYNYLLSLKKQGYKITTRAGRLVGSIATKIYLVGDEREISDESEFFIHNPFVDPGYSDANKLKAYAERVSVIENDLRSFYSEITGTPEDALKPLMDGETSMTADQAVALNFATKKTEEIKVLAKVKMIDDLLKKVRSFAGVKAMQEVKLADGKSVMIEAEPGADPKGASVTLDGQPAPDGEHALEGGKILVVSGGKVVEIKEVEVDDSLEAKVNKLGEAVKMIADALAGYEKKQEEKIANAVTALKAEIKTTHRPEKNAGEKFVAVKKNHDVKEIYSLLNSSNPEEKLIGKQMYFEKYGVEADVE